MKENPFKPNPSSHEAPDELQSYGFFRWSYLLLAIGFLTLAIASALSQFVMIGLLGLVLFPVSLLTLLIGGAVVIGENRTSWKRHVAGWATFFLGVLAVMFISAMTTSVAYNYVDRSSLTLLPYHWVFVTLGWVMSAVTIAASFMLKAGWSRPRCFVWGAVALAVPPASLLFFWILVWSGQALEA